MDSALYQKHYDVQKKHWWFVAKQQIVMSMIESFFKKDSFYNILDAGCGCGLMLTELQKIGTVSGMDFSEDAIQFSKKHFNGLVKKGELPGNLPYRQESFDLIVALDVVEHIEDDIGALKSLNTLLVKNGCGLFTVPAYMFLWSEHDDINQHKRRYTKTEFRKKIEEAGFVIEKISYYNAFLFPLIFLLRTISRFFKTGTSGDLDLPGRFVNYLLLKIFSFERFFLKYMNFPFGVSVIAMVRKS